jgi:hypothetical protein
MTANCLWCGAEFQVSGSGRPRKFCIRSHRQRAYESRKFLNGMVMSNMRPTHSHCYLCSEPLPWDDSPEAICFDHKIATVWGGVTTPANVRPVHVACNLSKGDSLMV